MVRRNPRGKNLMDMAFLTLFECEDERYVLYLLKHIPDVVNYLYVTNDAGWFPLFRVLHLFQHQLYHSQRV